jgi:outer membrane protein assembly factor BamB
MTMQPLEPDDPRIAGEFRLQARLGAGGMGQVYLGYSPAGRAVAVKICHPEFAADPDFVARFAREVAAARAVNGLYTAQVIDAGPDDSPPWLATSYVPGPSLHDAVTEHGPLPGPAVWRLAAGLAEALQAVHACGLIHRDLKPTNILLAADGPRVIDFGIARALDGTSLTTTGYTFGTPGYMAPEQAAGQPATPASDVFALGSILYFAATGDTPFGDGEPAAVLYRVVHTQPALETVPGPLRGLVADCLAKNPADRPTLTRVLRTCQTQAPRLGGPSASFWPGQVAALIASHQAGLDHTAQKPEPKSEPDGQPGDEPTQTIGGNLITPDRPAPPGPGSAPPPAHRTAGPVTRRQALAGLATAGLAAGLAVGGWAYTRSGSSRRPAPSQLLWARETGGPVTSGAALADGILYIGSDDGNVHAFDAATGRPVRTFPTSGAISAGVSVADGTLFAGSADHAVYAFRVSTGERTWAYRTGGPVNCTPTITDGTVYIGSDDGNVYAIHAGTGQLAWRYHTGGPVRSQPQPGTQTYSGSIYAGSDDSHLYALGTDGKPQWQVATSGPVTAGTIYAMGVVCVCDDNGRVFAVWADGTGKTWPKGEDNLGGAVRGTPAFAGETLYIGSAASAVYAVNIQVGALNWRYPTTGPVNSGPATDGTTVYAGDDDGNLYAIDITSISPRWRYRADAAVQSQILTANGIVYFGSQDHHVYALHA